MRWHRENTKMKEEAQELAGSAKQLANGNLDISINSDNYILLGDLSKDLNKISTTFNSYIDEISHILSHLSAGNMAVSFSKHINYQGDFMPIRNALHKIRHSLNNSFEEIIVLSNEVDKLCSRVENDSAQTAKNASEQAMLIYDLSNKINHITEQTSGNARNAKQASERINDIQSEIKHGNGYMELMLTSMQEVKASSHDISRIVTIISELAGQSRLLALNASIEAARAGESGKGFTVVANEVGKLAQRSADAVRQTEQLIEHSINTAEASAEIAGKTSESFRSIQTSVDSAACLCSEIAEVSEIQAKELQNTAVIITEISDVVQDDAAYAQENCACASDLVELSAKLKKVMTRFRLKNQGSSIKSENNINILDQNMKGYLLSKVSKVSEVPGIDAVLEEIIKTQKDFECLYVIDQAGYQVSKTILNPEILIEQEENFKPAMPGDYHGTKKYFLKAMKAPKEWYTSYEYISTATGGLCRTLSCSYESADHKIYVVCIDLICRY